MVVGSLNSCEDRKSIREPGTAIVWAERSSERVPRRFAHATALNWCYLSSLPSHPVLERCHDGCDGEVREKRIFQ